MFTQEEYLYGWLFYLLGVLIVMVCGWILTARLKWPIVRHLLRLIVGVALVVPWYAAPEMDYLAPAWLICAFEGIFEGEGAFWRAGGPLLSALGVALVIYLLCYALWSWRHRAQA